MALEKKPLDNADYLGDGVYIEFDGFQYRLWTQREFDTHEIFLEPAIVAALQRYLKRVPGEKS